MLKANNGDIDISLKYSYIRIIVDIKQELIIFLFLLAILGFKLICNNFNVTIYI